MIGLLHILQQRHWMIPYAYPALGNPCLDWKSSLATVSTRCPLLEEPKS